ncbi:MAG: hypothetical protein U7M05_12755, partial [Candidatus Igneacidithiobacillus chanchocoensis]
TKVEARGLAVAGGMLTLDARRLTKGHRAARDVAEKHGVEIYEAAWVKRGRGFQISKEEGFLGAARLPLGGIVSYHSTTAMGAVDGAIRKRANLPNLTECQNLADRLARREIDTAGIRVTIADAHATGACTAGIRSWCNRVGIDYSVPSVPLDDVLRGYQKAPVKEALAVIFKLVRDHSRSKAA